LLSFGDRFFLFDLAILARRRLFNLHFFCGVRSSSQPFVVLALLIAPVLSSLVIDRAQIGDLIDEHVNELFVVDVVGVMSDLRLCAQHNIVGFLRVRG